MPVQGARAAAASSAATLSHVMLAAAAPVGRGSVVVRSPSGIASDSRRTPWSSVVPAGEDAAPEAAPVVFSSTKYDVSYLSADNSVHHIPPNRIERNPASLEVWGWSWPALRTHTSHGSRIAGGSRHCRGLGRLQARKRRTGARESCLKQALPAQALIERGARNDDARQAAPAVDAAVLSIQKRR